MDCSQLDSFHWSSPTSWKFSYLKELRIDMVQDQQQPLVAEDQDHSWVVPSSAAVTTLKPRSSNYDLACSSYIMENHAQIPLIIQ